jgi:iron donor protein CyaY
MLDDQEFRLRSDEALDRLNRALLKAGDEHEFEADFNAGALTIDFDDPPGRFVVSPNAPVKQIWVSALSKSFKLEWNPESGNFVLPDSGETLTELLSRAVSQHIGAEVEL